MKQAGKGCGVMFDREKTEVVKGYITILDSVLLVILGGKPRGVNIKQVCAQLRTVKNKKEVVLFIKILIRWW